MEETSATRPSTLRCKAEGCQGKWYRWHLVSGLWPSVPLRRATGDHVAADSRLSEFSDPLKFAREELSTRLRGPAPVRMAFKVQLPRGLQGPVLGLRPTSFPLSD